MNVAANRAAVVLQTTGFSYSSDNTGALAPKFSMLNPAAATMAIDALDGTDWSTSAFAPQHVQAAAAAAAVGGQRLLGGDFWTDFWDWLKGAVATVTHVIVSVAEDIYAGIRVIANGVAHVFNVIITGIEQVANAIGAFFIELGHLIEELIEALSVLFQFGHIIDTHNLIKTELLNRINGVAGNSNYPGFAALIQSWVVTPVNTFFETGEQTISTWLDSMANALGGTPANGLAGGGSTVHSAFTATPGGGGTSSSTATQSNWALQKFSGGYGSTSQSATASSSSGPRLLDADDPIATAFTTFFNSLTDDPVLSNQWQQVKTGGQGLANATSAADFIKQGIAELLRILAGLIDGVLAVTKGLVDALLGVITALVDTMFGGNGLLVAPLDIPVLSWLYQLLFGEPLTILNAGLLLVSIPLTIIWRIIKGQWPSESLATTPGALGSTLAPVWQEFFDIISGVFSFILGFVFAVGDAKGAGSVPVLWGRVGLAFSMLSSACSVPSYNKDTPTVLDWTSWALSLTGGLLNILGSVNFSAATSTGVTELGPALLLAVSGLQMMVLGLMFDPAYNEVPPDPVSNAELGINIAAQLAGLINPLKLTSEIGAIIVAAVDFIMGIAAMVASFLSAGSVNAASPTRAVALAR